LFGVGSMVEVNDEQSNKDEDYAKNNAGGEGSATSRSEPTWPEVSRRHRRRGEAHVSHIVRLSYRYT